MLPAEEVLSAEDQAALVAKLDRQEAVLTQDLARRLDASVNDVLAEIVQLELSERVTRTPGALYRLGR